MALGDTFRLPIALVLYYYMPYSTMTIGLKVRPCEIQLAVMALSVKVEKLAVSCIFVGKLTCYVHAVYGALSPTLRWYPFPHCPPTVLGSKFDRLVDHRA